MVCRTISSPVCRCSAGVSWSADCGTLQVGIARADAGTEAAAVAHLAGGDPEPLPGAPVEGAELARDDVVDPLATSGRVVPVEEHRPRGGEGDAEDEEREDERTGHPPSADE